MKEYMHQFTNLFNDTNAIEELFEKIYKECEGDEKKEQELQDILENQMWKTWEDKTVDRQVTKLYEILIKRMEK